MNRASMALCVVAPIAFVTAFLFVRHADPGFASPHTVDGPRSPIQSFDDEQLRGYPVAALAFSPDGKLLAAARGRFIFVAEIQSQLHWRELNRHDRTIKCLAFSPDGTKLASGCVGGTVRQWHIPGGMAANAFEVPREPFDSATPESLAYAPDGRTLAATIQRHRAEGGPLAGEVCLWRRAGKEQLTFKARPKYFSYGAAEYVPDTQDLCLGTGNGVSLIDTQTGQERNSFAAPEIGYGWLVAVSPDGRYVSSAIGQLSTSGDERPQNVVVWELKTPRMVANLAGHKSAITDLVFAPEKNRIVSCGNDGTLRIWDYKAQRELAVRKVHDGKVSALAMSPDGQTIATGSSDGQVRTWQLAELLRR